jgi:hypothetical protein
MRETGNIRSYIGNPKEKRTLWERIFYADRDNTKMDIVKRACEVIISV